jgi:hypothetical protein
MSSAQTQFALDTAILRLHIYFNFFVLGLNNGKNCAFHKVLFVCAGFTACKISEHETVEATAKVKIGFYFTPVVENMIYTLLHFDLKLSDFFRYKKYIIV